MDRAFYYAALALVIAFRGIWWLDYAFRAGRSAPETEGLPRPDLRRVEAAVLGGFALVAWAVLAGSGAIDLDELKGPAAELLLTGAVLLIAASFLFRSDTLRASVSGLRTFAAIGSASVLLGVAALIELLPLEDDTVLWAQIALAVAIVAAEASRMIAGVRANEPGSPS